MNRSSPLRGTIIHARHFTVENGDIHVAASKRQTVGTAVHIGKDALRARCTVAVSVLRYVTDAWCIEPRRERLLRWQLNQLTFLHEETPLTHAIQFEPTVRVYVEAKHGIALDLEPIRQHLAKDPENPTPIFRLRILQVAHGEVVTAHLFPWEMVDHLAHLTDLAPYRAPVPADAAALQNHMPEAR